MPYTIRYHFSQHFAVPAKAAYEWCTDYRPDDHSLMGNPDAKRIVTWLTDSTVLLKETIPTSTGTVEKEKLVHLYPDRLMWVNTHLTGPNKYSQFIYQLSEETKGASRLDFNALHIEHKEKLTQQEIEHLQIELCHADSNMWKLLAKAMTKDLNK